MKLVFKKNTLLEIINTVQKAVSAKSVMPILECIKIEAYPDGSVIVTGNNLDISIEYRSECIVNEPGEIAINSRMFGEIIRRFPEGDVHINVNENNNVMFLKCQNSEFNIQGLSAVDYPAIPQIDEKYSFSMKQEVLKRMIRKTLYAISTNEAKKPILTGSLFEINTGVLSVVSTDGFRIAKVESIVESSLDSAKFVIPGFCLREIMKVLEEEEGEVKVVVAQRHVKFDFGGFCIISRLLEGEYVNYKPIFNTPNNIVVTVNTKDFTECIERAALIINDDSIQKNEKVPVRLIISDNLIDIACTTTKGRINDSLNVEKIGNDLEIGFNHKFLLEALKGCEDEVIKLELSNPKGACFIKPTQNNDYIYMLLPVRLYED